MVVVTQSPDDYTPRGLTPAMMASGNERLPAQHGMPMSTEPKPRLWATAPACRAVVPRASTPPTARTRCCAARACATSPAR
jgi:hypothetical protein